MLRAIFLIFILVITPRLFAFNCMHLGLREQVTPFVTKIAVIEEPGEIGRQSELEFAGDATKLPEVQNRFSGTGLLECNGYRGSAQLTGNNETITTCGHIFRSLDCKTRSNPSDCTFTVKNGDNVEQVKLEPKLVTGIKCPGKNRRENDWAVLKLREPIKNAKHYKLPYPDDDLKDEKVIAVAARGEDFKDGETKSIERCTSKRTFYESGFPSMYYSTCDPADGGSGGSILRPRAKYDVLMAISVAGSESDKELKAAVARGAPNSKPFSDNWKAYNVPLAGKFLSAVEDAVGGRQD